MHVRPLGVGALGEDPLGVNPDHVIHSPVGIEPQPSECNVMIGIFEPPGTGARKILAHPLLVVVAYAQLAADVQRAKLAAGA